MPAATWPMPGRESSYVRSAQSARSYEGIEHPATPSAAIRSRPRRPSTIRDYVGCRCGVNGIATTNGRLVRFAASTASSPHRHEPRAPPRAHLSRACLLYGLDAHIYRFATAGLERIADRTPLGDLIG